METSVIRLPDPAARLLRQVHPVLEELLGPATAGKWAIGGGTVLAARWQHRQSHDIDVFATEDVYRRAVANYLRARSEFDERMGRRLLRRPHPVTVDVGQRQHYVKWTLPIGDIDLIRSPRDFALTARPQTIDRTHIEAMTNEEILLGKIAGRGRDLKWRDFYDLAWAERHDPTLMVRVWNRAPTLAKHQSSQGPKRSKTGPARETRCWESRTTPCSPTRHASSWNASKAPCRSRQLRQRQHANPCASSSTRLPHTHRARTRPEARGEAGRERKTATARSADHGTCARPVGC